MSLFKAEYKDRQGQKRKSGKWYIDFCDHLQTRHKIPAFSDRRQSEALERNIKSLVNCRTSGLEPDIKLNQWLETIPTGLFKKLVSWGLVEGQRAEITKPLSVHISDYVKILEAKSFSADYVRRMKNRLLKIVQACRFFYFRDITQSAVELYIGKLKKEKSKRFKKDLSSTTTGHYLDALKTFLNWAVQDQRIISNPLRTLEKPARDSKRKGVLTPEQFIYLITNTFEKNVLIDNISGQERAILYFLAGTTGIRRNELLNLTWDDINLSDDKAFVRVKASIAKNGKEAFQLIPSTLVKLLKALRIHQRPQDKERVFKAFELSINTAELIRDDLKTAEIELIDKDGNEICFHSLRNSFISFLCNSETPAKVIQKMARHSDPRLTFNTYARTFEKAEEKALNFLPEIGNSVFAASLGINCEKAQILANTDEQTNVKDISKTVFLAHQSIPPRGIEPLLPG